MNFGFLRKYPINLVAGALLATILVLLWLGYDFLNSYRAISGGERLRRIQLISGELNYLGEALTDYARLAVLTGDPVWERRYRARRPRLAAIVAEARRLTPDYGRTAAAMTDAAYTRLVRMEGEAFDHIRAGRRERARAILFGELYRAQRTIYKKGTADFARRLRRDIDAVVEREKERALRNIIVIIVLIPLITFGWFLIVGILKRWRDLLEDNVREQERSARELHDSRENLRELLDRLDSSQRMLRMVMNYIPELIYWKDADLNYLGCNENFARWVGLESPEDIVGKTDFDLHWTRKEAEFIRGIDRIQIETGVADYHVVKPHKTDPENMDEWLWYDTNSIPLHDKDGKVIGILGTLEDITERKRAEELVQKYSEKLEEAVRARTRELRATNEQMQSEIAERKKAESLKDELVGTVSHELRTPLTSITGSLGLLRGGVAGELEPKARRMIDIAYDNSERLVRLINDILDIEKIQAGRMELKLQWLDITSLVERAIEANRAYAQGLNVGIEMIGEAPGVTVYVDEDRMIQVMNNLLSNAAKYSPRDGLVHVKLSAGSEGVRISVKDDGPGIPEDFRSRIFQKFSQADSSSTRGKGGTGLGLNITKTIVEKHGGSIAFECPPEGGTVFHFDLPVHQAPAKRNERDGEIRGGERRVLICEANPDYASRLKALLTEHGFAADTAAGAARLREMLGEKTYDAITLNPVLPDEDGITLMREIRREFRRLPVVIVSMGAGEEGPGAMMPADIVDWLDLPIDEERLLEALRFAATRPGGARPSVLHVEDDGGNREVVEMLTRDFADIQPAETGARARELLGDNSYDLILLDVGLPDGSGLELLPLFTSPVGVPTPVIIYSGVEIDRETTDQVAAVLMKSVTSNEMLLETIQRVIGRERPPARTLPGPDEESPPDADK